MSSKPAIVSSDDKRKAQVSKADIEKFLDMKAKKESVDKRFVDFMSSFDLRNHEGYAARWAGSHWETLRSQQCEVHSDAPLEELAAKETDLSRIALRWLKEHAPSDYSADKAEKIVRTLLLAIPAAPNPPQNAIIACRNAWLEIAPLNVGSANNPHAGLLALKRPDKEMGVFHAIDIDLVFAEGQVIYQPQSMPARSLFRDFLELSLPKLDVRSAVNEFSGYILASGLPSLQIHPLMIGTGRNGKGVYEEVISGMFNPERVAAMNIENLKGFALTPLLSASFVAVNEMPQRLNDTSILKSLLGEGVVQVDRKNKDPVALRSHARWLFSTNHPLKSTDGSSGFWSRFFIIPWETEVPADKRIPGLSGLILKNEKHIVLDWMLEGLVRLMARGGKMIELEQSKLAREEARIHSDSFLLWKSEAEPRLSATAQRVKSEVYESYAAWAKRNGVGAVGGPEFWKRCKSEFPGLITFKRRINGKQEWMSNFVFETDAPDDSEAPAPAPVAGEGEQAAKARWSECKVAGVEEHSNACPFEAYSECWDALDAHWESLALPLHERGRPARDIEQDVAGALTRQGACLKPGLAQARRVALDHLMTRRR